MGGSGNGYDDGERREKEIEEGLRDRIIISLGGIKMAFLSLVGAVMAGLLFRTCRSISLVLGWKPAYYFFLLAGTGYWNHPGFLVAMGFVLLHNACFFSQRPATLYF